MLQALIEHVANHDHSALRPLSHAAKIGMAELRLGSVALNERTEHGDHGFDAYRMAPGDVFQNAKPFGRKILHGCLTPGDRDREVAGSLGNSVPAGSPNGVFEFLLTERCEAA